MSRYPTEWLAAGACLSKDPDLFFPVATGEAGAKQAAAAQRVCGTCRVWRECLEYALSSGQTHGIWGGTTPEERIQARRRRASRQHRHAREREKVSAA